LEVPDAGTLVIDGRDTADRRRRRLLHGRVGYVMQHPERQLFAETVWEDVAFGPRNLGLAVQEVEQRCHEALAMVGLLDREGTSPFHLSGGQQRLCAIAGILAMRPTILVLDEPTAGLDPHGRAQLHGILRRIHEAGTTIVQVTHSMTDAARCEQILVLDEGRLRLQGRPEEVFCDAHVDELHAIGLGIPDALAWARELEEAGVPMLGRPLTLDALADALSRACASADETVAGEHGI
jgi:energy-coupling factor transport system ATP-binding protein